MSLVLTNPHSVLAVLHSRPEDLLELRVARGVKRSGLWKSVLETGEDVGTKIVEGNGPSRGGRKDAGRSGSFQALVKERKARHLDAFFPSDPPANGLWVGLDGVQDPQNVGSIFRTASFFGLQGIVLTKDRSAGLTGTVYDVASGGLESVPFSVPPNFARAIETARSSGLWILGTSEHADTDLAEVDLGRPWLALLGNEERGLRRLTLDKCDVVCRIPEAGAISSLNVSVAAGILMHALQA